MTTKATDKMVTVEKLEEIPAFADESEERHYWDTHELSERLWATLPALRDDEMPPPRPRTTPVAVRFDQDVVQRLKALAKKKHKGYQTLLKEFVSERLYEEEKREGIIR